MHSIICIQRNLDISIQFSYQRVVQIAQSPLLTAWWHHQMEIFSALLAICAGNSPVPNKFPTQRPVTRSFDVFFDLHLNKQLSKQWWGWWFGTLSCPLWRHHNGNPVMVSVTVLQWRYWDIYPVQVAISCCFVVAGGCPVCTVEV